MKAPDHSTEVPESLQIQKMAFLSGIKDGLIEISIGIMMFIVGLTFLNIFFIILLAILRILWKKIRQKIKIAWIYQRIGVVELNFDYKKQLKRYSLYFALVQSAALILLFVIVYFINWKIDTLLTYVPIIICAGLIGEALYFCMFSGKRNYAWVGIISIALAISFILYPFPSGLDHTVYYAWTEALFMICVGMIKFRRFLRKNPIIQEMSV